MKSNDKKISISIRKYKNGKEVIQLRRLPILTYGDKKLSTGDEPTEYNLQKYKVGGLEEWKRLETPQKPLTFKALCKEVLVIINASVSPTTITDRLHQLETYVYPVFGNMLIEEIDAGVIDLWQQRLNMEKGADYTRRCKQLVKRIFTKAVASKKILTNPMEGTERIKGNSSKLREIYSKEEIALMLTHSTGWLHLFILIRVYLGLRSAEMVGLKWSDIDYLNQTVKIERGIRWGRFKPVKGGERIVDLPQTVSNALKEHQKEAVCEYVFFTERYQNYWSDCSYINIRHFQPFLKCIGVKYKSFYSLRHSHATYSLAEGQPLAYVSHNLGHKKISTTTDCYIKHVAKVGGASKTEEIFKF